MVDPLDLQVMEFLEKRAGVKVEPFIADLSDVEAAISDQYGKSLGTGFRRPWRKLAARPRSKSR